MRFAECSLLNFPLLHFFQASRTAEEQEKWLLVNIQKIDVFESLRLNRDTWSNPALLSLVRFSLPLSS